MLRRALLVVLACAACQEPAEPGALPPGATGVAAPAAAQEAAPRSPAATGPAATGAPDVSPASLLAATRDICSSETVLERLAALQDGEDGAARAATLRARRQQARAALLRRAHRRALEIQEMLGRYLAFDEAGLAAIRGAAPARCDYLERSEPALWQELQHAQAALAADASRQHAVAAFHGSDALPGVFSQLVFAAHEVELLGFLDRHWRDGDLLPEGAEAPDDSQLPPVYPANRMSGSHGPPALRLSALDAMFPLLRRPASYWLAFPAETLAHWLVRRGLALRGEEGSVEDSFRDDLRGMFAALWAEHATQDGPALVGWMRERGYLLPEEASGGPPATPRGLAQRKYVLVIQRFARELSADYLQARALGTLQGGDALKQAASAELVRIGRRWADELGQRWTALCSSDTGHIEQDPYALALYLSDAPADESYEILDGYCHTSWRRTAGSVADALIKLGGYVTLAIAVVALPQISVPLVGAVIPTGQVAGWMIGYALLRDAVRSVDALHLESALYSPALEERQGRQLSAGAHVLAGATAALAVPRIAQAARDSGMIGWRALVPDLRHWTPYKHAIYWVPIGMSTYQSLAHYRSAGSNPFTDFSFYGDLVATHFMLMAAASGAADPTGTQVRSFAEGLRVLGGALRRNAVVGASAALVFLGMDDAIQQGKFLLQGELQDERWREFLVRWIPLGVAPNLILNTTICTAIDLFASSRGAAPWLNFAFQASWSALQRYFYNNTVYTVVSRFMTHRELGFSETLALLRPEDVLMVANDMCERPETALERRACSSREGADRFAATAPDEPLVALFRELEPVQELLRSHRGQPLLDGFMDAGIAAARSGQEASSLDLSLLEQLRAASPAAAQ
jgi:hypothetical protein